MREEARIRRAHDDPDVWLALSIADYYFLIDTTDGGCGALPRGAGQGQGLERILRRIRGAADPHVPRPRRVRRQGHCGARGDRRGADPARSSGARASSYSPDIASIAPIDPHRFPAAKVAAATEAIAAFSPKGAQLRRDQGLCRRGERQRHHLSRGLRRRGDLHHRAAGAAGGRLRGGSVNDAGPEWSERYHKLVQRCAPRILANSADLPPWAAERRTTGSGIATTCGSCTARSPRTCRHHADRPVGRQRRRRTRRHCRYCQYRRKTRHEGRPHRSRAALTWDRGRAARSRRPSD